MSSPPPTKPPRGVKQGKETSGLLMSVIRTLSASETNEQREKERAKLEKEYKKSDARLDELVDQHAAEILEVMQKFSVCSDALGTWGARCDAAVARLAACGSLLRLRHDDLRRLWREARTMRHALDMLTDIERVVVSENNVRAALAAGRVLQAASTLRAAAAVAGSGLAHVSALKDTRRRLEAKKWSVVEAVLLGLSQAVYKAEPVRPSAKRRTALLIAELNKNEEVTETYLQDITPEFEASLSEEDRTFEVNVMIYLEALGELEQLEEAAEKFKVQIQSELLEVIETVTRRVLDEGESDTDCETEQDGDMLTATGATEMGRPFSRLLEYLIEEFKACAERNNRLLHVWRLCLQRHNIPSSCLHTEQHYWSAVQQLLQLVLTEYLDVGGVRARGPLAASAAPHVPDYFARRRPVRPRPTLYRRHAPGVEGAVGAAGAGRRRVCSARPELLHAALPHLHALLPYLEARTGGGECSLRAFICDYVRWGETARLGAAVQRRIDAALAERGAWRQLSAESRSVLQCVAAAWRGVAAGGAAAARCGALGGAGAARALLPPLGMLSAAARCRLQPSPAHRAARWLADDDIVRFLMSLPNWKAVTSKEPINEDKQFEQELQQAYVREAEILGSSLGDSEVTKKEIASDVSTLAPILYLCESMNWLTANVRSLPAIFSPTIKLSDKFLGEIEAAAAKFEEIEHKCLLYLHLEVRIQCFHYLGQAEAATFDENSGSTKLARALTALNELAAPVLAPQRLAYIWNGVGEMMSARVVFSWQSAGAGCAGLRALRHCLGALRQGAAGLGAAHQYLLLLNATPQEIISSIREKGPQFSELEYLNAFKVIASKRGISAADMKVYLKQLSDALGHIGVTV